MTPCPATASYVPTRRATAASMNKPARAPYERTPVFVSTCSLLQNVKVWAEGIMQTRHDQRP